MDKLRIRGGRPLKGEVHISGAKNAALPELCAALLTDQPVMLRNVPRLRDVATMRHLLENMGVQTQVHGERGGFTLQAATPIEPVAPYELVKTMRASVLVLGPLLASVGEARVAMPGGDDFGSRPIDMHLSGLEALGVDVTAEEEDLL
jgi:UDP-N-acetylglucosamine 1-carboxyvinyltransferase